MPGQRNPRHPWRRGRRVWAAEVAGRGKPPGRAIGRPNIGRDSLRGSRRSPRARAGTTPRHLGHLDEQVVHADVERGAEAGDTVGTNAPAPGRVYGRDRLASDTRRTGKLRHGDAVRSHDLLQSATHTHGSVSLPDAPLLLDRVAASQARNSYAPRPDGEERHGRRPAPAGQSAAAERPRSRRRRSPSERRGAVPRSAPVVR